MSTAKTLARGTLPAAIVIALFGSGALAQSPQTTTPNSTQTSRQSSPAPTTHSRATPATESQTTASPTTTSETSTNTRTRTASADKARADKAEGDTKDADRTTSERTKDPDSTRVTGTTGTVPGTYDGSPKSSTTPPPDATKATKGGHASHGTGNEGERVKKTDDKR